MSDRHMHITGYLYPNHGVGEFIRAAGALGFFHEVIPVRRGDGEVIAVAFWSKDLDGHSDEAEMPDVCEKLSGILDEDIVIASAWQFPRDGENRRTAWVVRGGRVQLTATQ